MVFIVMKLSRYICAICSILIIVKLVGDHVCIDTVLSVIQIFAELYYIPDDCLP